MPWHLRIGQQIIDERAAPTIDYYNHTLLGKSWVDHEWLFNGIFYYLYNNFGYISLHKEMANYPRSVTYYLSKLDSKSKDYLEMLDDESLQMKFVFIYEMHNAIRNLYRTLQKIIIDLKNALEEIDTEEIKILLTNPVKNLWSENSSHIENMVLIMKHF